MNFARHLYRVAVWLPVDIQQDCRLSVCRNHRVQGLDVGSYFPNIPNPHRNTGGSVLDNSIRDFHRRSHLSVDQTKVELMVLLQQSRRIDEIRLPNGIKNVGDRYACG